ncbi:Proteasome subunit beta [Balamuthia mandrillaris]
MLPTPTYGPSDFCFAGQKNEFFQINYNASAPAVPAKRTLDPYVTGTSVLAIKYKDGVMMTADTLGSYGSLARFKDLRRIRKLGDNTLIGGSGEYSDYQYLMTVLEELIDTDKAYEDGNKLRPQEIYSYLTRVMYGRRNKFDPLWNQLVVAGVRDGVRCVVFFHFSKGLF